MRYGVLALAILSGAVHPVSANDTARLLWSVRTTGGTVVSEQDAGTPCNPASVLKLGTALLALDRLGPDHRYTTAFAATGTIDTAHGVLHGDLVVLGGADPDFQLENAWLVAGALGEAGVRTVTGNLVVAGRFWMGWDHGFAGTAGMTGEAIRLRAGRRLLRAWDPSRWTASIRKGWTEWSGRRPGTVGPPPSVIVRGRVRTGTAAGRTVVVHRSNPLLTILRRFLTYSNNDIVRIAVPLGGPGELERFLARRLEAQPGTITVASASGEGVNRMTPRLGVRLLDTLRGWLGGYGLSLRDLLPVPGCVPGPLPRMFPHFAHPPLAGTLACKTGTLDATDGGVAVLAGTVETRDAGTILFFVAAPRAGSDLRRWRHVEQRWLEDLIGTLGGAVAHPCPPPFPYSDENALAERVDLPRAERPAGLTVGAPGATIVP